MSDAAINISESMRYAQKVMHDSLTQLTKELVDKAFEDIKLQLNERAAKFATSFAIECSRLTGSPNIELVLRFPDDKQ
jgi:hypothetical protein